MPPTRRLLALLVVAAAVAGCGGDTAALVDPGTSPVTADVGDLRVLRHRDDPTAGDRWVTVLETDPAVFERTGSFREEGSRTAEDDQPADVRLLYEARAAGRTLLVRMDCRGCGDDGVPSTSVGDTELLVWELVAGGAAGPARLGPQALAPGQVREVEVGDHVVVVRPADAEGELELDGRAGAAPVLRHVAAAGAPLAVDVFAAVAAGAVDVVDPASGDRYGVRASG